MLAKKPVFSIRFLQRTCARPRKRVFGDGIGNMMVTITEAQRQTLIQELELHKTEFSALGAAILHWLDADRQYLNLTLVAVAAGLGIIPFIIEQQVFFVLLFFSLIFHVLLYEMLATNKILNDLSLYVVEIVIPRVNVILDQLGDERQGLTVWGWEVQSATRPFSRNELLLISLTPTRQWVPILAIAALLLAYLFITQAQGISLGLGDLALILVNLVFLIWAAARNALYARTAIQHAETIRQHYKQAAQVAETTKDAKEN